MEEESKINLKQYLPQKASKIFMLKIVLYVTSLALIVGLFYKRFNKPEKKLKMPTEIHHITIEP